MVVIIITSHTKTKWDGGDSIITYGLKVLLPELDKHELIYSAEIPHNETDNYVKSADYVIHAGTPSWLTTNNRRFWKSCIKYQKPIWMLGIGLTVHYLSHFWDGAEDFVNLKNTGLIKLIVCRDKLCYYWLCQKLGFDTDKIHILPCPAFYSLPPIQICDKKEIVYSLPNINETSRQNDWTFVNFYDKSSYIVSELRKNGSNVHLLYQRSLEEYPDFNETFKKYFPDDKINYFTSQETFIDFMEKKEVYIGVRNHGALPSSGAGKLSLLLGTDYRQYLADEIPFLTKIDISYCDWQPRTILDWYHSLDVESISKSLMRYRNITYNHWQELLAPLKLSLT